MKLFTLAALSCASVLTVFAAPGSIHLLQKPTMNKTEIVFSYAGDLWRVSREGGVATRLTPGPASKAMPPFRRTARRSPSPASTTATSTSSPSRPSGGIPKRVTYHPDADRVVGWTPDGKRILFRSNRDSQSRYTQLYTVPPEGGLPEALPLPMGCMGAYSPDGKRMVYAADRRRPVRPRLHQLRLLEALSRRPASYLWMVNLADLTTVKMPRTDSNDIYPMWIGDKIYFLSDRNGPMTLFRYDPQSKKVTELIKNTGKDIVSASAGPGGIVYEQFGQIHIYDIASGKEHAVQHRDRRRPHRSASALPECVARDPQRRAFRPPACAPCSKRTARF